MTSLFGVGAMTSCLDPTQVTVEITTDAICSDLDEVQIAVAPPEELAASPPAAIAGNCDASGRIGDIVITPAGRKDQGLSFQVVAGVGKPTSRCFEDGFTGGCIVARRSLSFIPRRPLMLPVELELECLDVPCGFTQTCRKGKCVSATIEDPSDCNLPGGCGDDFDSGVEGTGGASTGGASTGGASTGGASTGGASTGGASTGGASTGGMGGGGGLPVGDAHLAMVTTTSDLADAPSGPLSDLAMDPGADGRVSLREAIFAANLTPNLEQPDAIEFAIPGDGPHTITVGEMALPAITDAVAIDGFSQFPGQYEVVIDGGGIAPFAGLQLVSGSDGSTVAGLVIIGFDEAGIDLENSGGHTVQGCLVGVEADGETAHGNGVGIRLLHSSNNLIGGSLFASPRQSNVVSGNRAQGILLTGTATVGNSVSGNIVGLTRAGNQAAGNQGHGVEIRTGANSNTVGAVSANSRNVISANEQHGVRISGENGGAYDNIIIGNFIGVDLVGSANPDLGNGWSGVRLRGDVRRSRIGGVEPGSGNRISYNEASGVRVGEGETLPVLSAILGNEISSNGKIGIELYDEVLDEVTLNDEGDVDGGANGTQNYPEIVSTSYAGGEVTVHYTLDTLAGDYRIEFFGSVLADDICAVDPASPPACLEDSLGPHYHGEGAGFFHNVQVTVAGSGPQALQVTFPVSENFVITSTCTPVLGGGVFGGTSEFSRAVPTTMP